MENAKAGAIPELELDSQIRGEEEHTTNSAASTSSPTATGTLMEDSNNQLLHDGSDESPNPDSANHANQADSSSGHIIDTAAPFESVKAAVSKFGGFGDWKPHRGQDMERPKFVEREVDKVQEKIPEYKKQLEDCEDSKMQVLKELESTKRRIEELKLSLERVETQENEVKELNIELIATKEALDSAHAAHLEAQDKKIGAAMTLHQDNEYLEKQLKQTQEEIQRLDQQIQSTNDLKLQHDNASALLLDLKAELAAAYMELKETDGLSNDDKSQISEIQDAITSVRKDLEEMKLNIQKVTAEVDLLKLTADSLKLELRKEKSCLATIKQRQGMTSVAVASLEAQLDKSRSQIAEVQTKETKARDKMAELPKQVQKATQVAYEAKLLAQIAHEEMRKAKVEAEKAKVGAEKAKVEAEKAKVGAEKAKVEAEKANAAASTTESRLVVTQKEIQSDKAQEKFSLPCIKELQESESCTGVSLPLDEYNNLSKRAREAEEEAKRSLEVAICRMKEAKQAESRSLERLKEVKREVGERKETLRCAMEKADKAKEQRKLGIEQELRKWRAEHEHLRRASEKKEMNSSEHVHVQENPKPHANGNGNGNKIETESAPQAKSIKKKKKLIQRCSCLCPKRKSRK